MKHVTLPCEQQRRLSFHLAMEEYVARHIIDGSDLFFLWQVAPSVIYGRNQQLESEVDVDYCREHGIAIYRRKSGGGCVYADEQNLMLSLITSDETIGMAFNKLIGMIVLVLRRLGIEAVATAHNDVLIDGRKVSGTACYRLPGRNIVHATLLYDTCMPHMLHAITPPASKLQPKGIQSVRQRITLLKDHTTLTLPELKAFIISTLCTGDPIALTAADVEAIGRLEASSYLSSEQPTFQTT